MASVTLVPLEFYKGQRDSSTSTLHHFAQIMHAWRKELLVKVFLELLVLGIWEPEVTMARGMLMLTRRFWLPPTLATPMPVTASVTLVIPILLPMDMETLAMLDLAMPAMLVLDSAMDIPTLPLLEPAEIILELLSHAKFEQLLLPVCYH